ncbi:MAG: N-methyl-L-tryptophan oxidase [Pirellulales bacterium]
MSTPEHYDCIVLGTGGVGSAALAHLSRRGAHVLGLDRYPPGHDRGSSHGQTRIIRQAYFEHPDYVPLAQRAYDLWDQLSDRTGKPLKHEVGLVQVGPAEGPIVSGVLASARRHGLQIDQYSPREMSQLFPGLEADEQSLALYERRAGFLLVEDCVRAHAEDARQSGAKLDVGHAVRAWRMDGGDVVVETDAQQYRAAALVIAAGAWAGEVLAGLNLDLTVRRKLLHWYACDDPRYRVEQGFPCFFYEVPTGYFYGFPQLGDAGFNGGLKIARHSGGEDIEDPLQLRRDPQPGDAEDKRLVEEFLSGHLPGVSRRHMRQEACMYTMSRDEHFIVDRHPDHPQVVFAAGLSGHGFKFTPALGQALAELVLDDRTDVPVGFLGLRRK